MFGLYESTNPIEDFATIIVFLFMFFSLIRLFLGKAVFYTKKTFFFTENERNFYKQLKKAVYDQYEIFGQVRVADVLNTNNKLGRDTERKAFFKISSKHFDYVLCDKNTLEIIAAIELDDSSHNKKERIERDNFLNSACEGARLPLLRVKARYNYNYQTIKIAVDTLLNEIASDTKNKVKPTFIHAVQLT